MKTCLCLLVAGSVLYAVNAGAFARAKIGDVIENVELAALDGAKHPLLTNATANVFVFLKPGQEHTRTTMVHLAACEKEMAGKPVHWVAVVSDRIPRPEVEAAVQQAGLAMPVLIDAGDALYGKLGVVLCPVLGITDQNHKLVAYEYFTKINFAEVLRARLRFLLREIDKQELQRVLNPPGATQGAAAEKAHRRFKLAEKLFQAKNFDKALINLNESIDLDGTVAAAHALKGRILLAQGNREAARAAFAQALKLDPDNASAREGLQLCGP